MIKNRVIWKAIALSIVTFGIYGIVWQVKVKGELNEAGADIPTAWWLIVPIGNIWWLWKYSEGVEQITKEKYSAGLSFALLFLTSIIGQAIIQTELNKIAGPMSKEDLAKSKKSTIALIVGLVLFFVLMIVAVASSSDEISNEIKKNNSNNKSQDLERKETEQPEKEAVFTTEVVSYDPVDPATLNVIVKITNSGEAAKVPSCEIAGSNANGSYKGFDLFELTDPIEPGGSYTFNGNITITNEGSFYVTEVTADCS